MFRVILRGSGGLIQNCGGADYGGFFPDDVVCAQLPRPRVVMDTGKGGKRRKLKANVKANVMENTRGEARAEAEAGAEANAGVKLKLKP